MNNELITCRICLTDEYDKNKFIAPCNCKGTIKYVHNDCFNLYLIKSNPKDCKVCKYVFNIKENIDPDYLFYYNYPLTPVIMMGISTLYLFILGYIFTI